MYTLNCTEFFALTDDILDCCRFVFTVLDEEAGVEVDHNDTTVG